MTQAFKLYALAEASLAGSGAGSGVFVRYRRSDGFLWNTSGTPAFEVYTGANVANYAIQGVETPAGSGQYYATDPAPTTEGVYRFFKQAGANFAASDFSAGIRYENAAGPVSADVEYVLGTAPTATGGILDVNTKLIAGQTATLDANNLLQVDVEDIKGTAAVGTAGYVNLDSAQAIPTSNTANTLGDCLNAARAQGFGKWTISGTTLTLFAPDGTTAVRIFTLDSASAPTSRT